MLEIAALGAADEPRFLRVSDAVAVGVTVDEDIEGVGLVDEHPIVERQHHAWQDHLVAEEDVLIEFSVALGALVAGDDTNRVMLVLTVDVLHVGTQLGDVHAAVAVEGQIGRLTQAVALAEDELKPIAFREFDGLQLFFGRESLDGRLRGEVGLIGLLVGSIGSHEGKRRQEDSGSHGGMKIKLCPSPHVSSPIPCSP